MIMSGGRFDSGTPNFQHARLLPLNHTTRDSHTEGRINMDGQDGQDKEEMMSDERDAVLDFIFHI
jgi:hypothetical protein